MKHNIRFSSIHLMLELIERHKQGTLTSSDVLRVLAHEDYAMEVKRYGKAITRDEFCTYLMQFPKLSEAEVTNTGLRAHHAYYLDLYHHLDNYRENLSKLESITAELLAEQICLAQKGLPSTINLDDINFVFTIGIGQSFGYVYESNTHFDFLQLVKDNRIDDFQSTIAHEVHHVGFNRFLRSLDLSTLTLEGLFYLYFAGEGLAVKYCNNAEGVLSKAIYATPKNVGLDGYTWKWLMNDFPTSMERFHVVVQQIRSNTIKSEEELMKELRGFWMNPHVDGQPVDLPPRLKHFRLYSFGNEIWGILHDCFGKDGVFEILKDLEWFPVRLNEAFDMMKLNHYRV